MSLDIYVTEKRPVKDYKVVVRILDEDDSILDEFYGDQDRAIAYLQDTKEVTIRLDSANVTHNLADLAEALQVYDLLWCGTGIKAGDALGTVKRAKGELLANKDYYKKFESPGGWGTVADMVRFLSEVVSLCEDYPEALFECNR